MEPQDSQQTPNIANDAAPAASMTPQNTPLPSAPTTAKTPEGSLLTVPASILLATLIVSVVIGFGFWMIRPQGTVVDPNKAINGSEYQALFLTNGQVYFGKLSDLGQKYVVMTNIYYLQVQQGQTAQQVTSTTAGNAEVSLAKLGNELHGPEDRMSVASDQVLFWENMKDSSKVVQAIHKYQNQ